MSSNSSQSSYYVNRYCKQRAKREKTPESTATISFVDRYIAERGHLIHKLKAKDSTGRWAYYFVLVKPADTERFLAAMKSNKTIDLEDYGSVIASCYGESPDDKVKKELQDRFGFSV